MSCGLNCQQGRGCFMFVLHLLLFRSPIKDRNWRGTGSFVSIRQVTSPLYLQCPMRKDQCCYGVLCVWCPWTALWKQIPKLMLISTVSKNNLEEGMVRGNGEEDWWGGLVRRKRQRGGVCWWKLQFKLDQAPVQCSKVRLCHLADKSPMLLIYRMESDLSNV